MAGSINKVILIGSLGKDPEIKQMQNGSKIAMFSMATSERWKDKTTGEQKENTEWHKVVVYNPNVAGVVESMCQKGTRVYIEGSLKTRKWQNQQGQDVYTTEVVLQQFGGQMIILSNAKQKSDAPEQVDDLSIDNIPF